MLFFDLYRNLPNVLRELSPSLGTLLWGIGIIIAGAAIGPAILGINYLLKTETGKVTAAYIKAKKQKVCPLIEFV